MKNKKLSFVFNIIFINFELCDIFFIFQNYINNVLHEYFDYFYIIYINNILIYNESKKKYIKRIRFILTRLREMKF